jgi:hypothetical protein
MRRLAETIATDPSQTFQVCVDLALELCDADTCGISLRGSITSMEPPQDIFPPAVSPLTEVRPCS